MLSSKDRRFHGVLQVTNVLSKGVYYQVHYIQGPATTPTRSGSPSTCSIVLSLWWRLEAETGIILEFLSKKLKQVNLNSLEWESTLLFSERECVILFNEWECFLQLSEWEFALEFSKWECFPQINERESSLLFRDWKSALKIRKWECCLRISEWESTLLIVSENALFYLMSENAFFN